MSLVVWRHDGHAGFRAIRLADVRVEQAQVIVNLRGGGDDRARAAAGTALLDGDGRRQALDEVHVRLLHLVEELPGVGGERFDVFALALGVDGVERERRLARAAQAGDDHQLVARDVQREVLEVVLTRAADPDEFFAHGREFLQLNNRQVYSRTPWKQRRTLGTRLGAHLDTATEAVGPSCRSARRRSSAALPRGYCQDAPSSGHISFSMRSKPDACQAPRIKPRVARRGLVKCIKAPAPPGRIASRPARRSACHRPQTRRRPWPMSPRW